MGCPEGWLDWDAYGVLIQAGVWVWLSTSITPVSFCSNHFQPRQNCPRSLIMWNYRLIKIKFWLTLGSFKDAEAPDILAGSWTVFRICFPSCVICHSHVFVLRELLTHWKCTKEYNKDMCHTLHPYYAGNDKWDRQSLQHTVRSALQLT